MRHRWAFIEDSAPQKITAKTLSVGIFYDTDFYKRQKKKLQREEKEDLSPAIGKKFPSKKVFLFGWRFFSYRVNAKNQKDIVTEKEDKKFPLFFSHLLFILFLRGED